MRRMLTTVAVVVATTAFFITSACGGAAPTPDRAAPDEAAAATPAPGPAAEAPAKKAAPAKPVVKVNPNKRPGESDDTAAERLNEEGKVLVRKGAYAKALVKFRAALELFPLSNAIFNVGSMLYTLKRHADAYPYLEQTLKQPLAAEQRKVVLKYRAEVMKAVAKTHKNIQVASNPPGATLVLNSNPLPYPTPTRILIPYGRAELVMSYPGFAEKKIVVESTSAVPPKDISARLARAVISAKVSVRCPEASDVFVDSQIRGYEKVELVLPAGTHVIRCGKGSASKAFEREIKTGPGGSNAFDFHRDRR